MDWQIYKKQHSEKKSKKGCRLFLWIVLFLCIGICQSTKVEAKQKTVKVGYYIRKSFQEGDKDWKPKSGYGYEYMQKIASYTGWHYQYVYGSWEELYEKLQSGQIDIMAGISYAKDREKTILYPEKELLNETYYIYMSRQYKTIKVGEIASYRGKRIGIQGNNPKMLEALKRWKREQNADIDVISYDDFNACAKAFHKKKIDGFVSADNIVSSYSGIVPVEKIGKEPYYLCVSKKRAELLNELNDALTVIYEQDARSMDELTNKYTAETAVSVFLSKEERDYMKQHDTITVGYSNHYIPYSDTKNGKPTGLVKDIVPDLFKSLPGTYSPKIIYKGFDDQKEMIKDLKSGKVDMIFPVSDGKWYSEQHRYQQSSSVITAPIAIVYKGKFDSSTTKKIAINKNNLLQYCYVIEKYPNAKLRLCDSADECIEALKAGRVSSTLISATQSDRVKDQNKKLKTVILMNSEKLCFGVSTKNSALLKLLNQGITVLGDSYGINHVYHYINQESAYTIEDIIKDNIGIVVILFIVILLVIILYLIVHEKKQYEIAQKELQQKRILEEALDQARQATAARTIFLRNMSHDIRTPLNAVIGFTDLALKEEKDIDKIKEYLSKINASGEYLLEIVNNVLEISRIESGQTKLDESAWDLREIINEVQLIVAEQARKKAQTFVVDVSEMKDSYIYCDKLRVREILLNLLINSVKFTQNKGNIALKLIQKESQIEGYADYEMLVEDNGRGMSQEFLNKIFEPFEREATSTDSGIEGTGLGMSIVKRFVDMMDGTIDIISKEQEGTKVIVKLKFCIAPSIAVQQNEEPQEQYQFKGKKILLAEDNEMNREITEEILKEVGFLVDSVGNGKEAIEKLQSSQAGLYDAILMDIQMPVMDGYEATKYIRNMKDPKLNSIPIIALSANAFEEDKELSLSVGMNDHLAKPFEATKLMEILNNFTE